MPRPKKEKPNHGQLYEVKISYGSDADGKPLRKSFYSSVSKADARKKADEWKLAQQVEVVTGEPLASADMPFDAWARQWLRDYKRGTVKENTYRETYERTVEKFLIPHFGRRSIAHIQPAQISGFLNQQAQKYTDTTLSKMRLCLRGIFGAAIDNGLLVRDPTRNLRPVVSRVKSGEKRTYTATERDTLVEFCKTHRFGLGVRILVECGLRCSELCGLQVGDIDLDARTLSVRRASTADKHKPRLDVPKSAKSVRTIPIGRDLCEQIRREFPDAPPETQIVVSAHGELYSPDRYTQHRYNLFMRDFVAAHPDIPRLSPHELRHTCGTLLYQRTHDIHAVSKYLGHANIGITSRLYVHDDADSLRGSLGID